MALTPDDVVDKEFQYVRFNDGLDPDEVDDFLDEIVVEWRKTLDENTQLKARMAELEAAAAAPAGGPVIAPVAQIPPVTPASPPSGDEQSTGIIAVAQRLHDEY